MNLFYAVKETQALLEAGEWVRAEQCLRHAKAILNQFASEGAEDLPFICCVFIEEDLIHCGRKADEPLFPGNREERVLLCAKCRDDCRKKIDELGIVLEKISHIGPPGRFPKSAE